MSRGARFGLIAAAIAIAVVAFIALRPGDDDDERAGTPAGEQTSQDGGGATTGGQQEQPPPEPPVERIRVRGGEPVGGVREIEVESGDEVRLAVTSDVADHVHVHGYDLFKDVEPGGTARFTFDADLEGIFEIELEDRGLQIAELRVVP